MSTERIDVEALRGHTPGPLAVQDIVGTTDKGNTYIFSATGDLLALVLHACQSKPAEYSSPDRILRARADARLFAASPALLAEVIERRARDAAVADLVEATNALVGPPLRYCDATIEVACSDHSTAMQVVARVRNALATIRIQGAQP